MLKAVHFLSKPGLSLAFFAALTLLPSITQAQDDATSNEFNTDLEEPQLDGVGGLHVIPVKGTYRDPLANTAAAAISSAKRRTLSTDVHTPWQILHALLGLRKDFRIDDNGKSVSGLEWVSSGPKFEDEDWFLPSEWGGKAHPYSKPYAFEGHANQTLAILSMLGLPPEHRLKAGNQTITIGGMIQNAKMELTEKEEVSWSLWSLSRYLHPDAQWQNKHGETWTIERMAKLQLDRLHKRPMMKHPCGGAHAMFALAHARNIRLQSGLQLRGTWLQVDQQIRKCIELARVQQQSNGQFSTKFFDGKATDEDFDKRIASAGHILEFLMIALPQRELNASWVRRGVEATAKDIMSNSQSYVKCGPLYHAVNGLAIYLDRTQGNGVPERIALKPSGLKPTPKLITPNQKATSAPRPLLPNILAPKVPADPSTNQPGNSPNRQRRRLFPRLRLRRTSESKELPPESKGWRAADSKKEETTSEPPVDEFRKPIKVKRAVESETKGDPESEGKDA